MSRPAQGSAELGGTVFITLLGRFAIAVDGRIAGPWPRPTARRLCELVLVSPERRISREAVCEALFPNLGPEAAGNALSKALTMARTVLSDLGGAAASLVRADRSYIWASSGPEVVSDLEPNEEALQAALHLGPGVARDQALASALEQRGVLLEDEPYAEWALRRREHLEWARQEARLELARDRTRGHGRSSPEAVIEAWEDCLASDPTSEEAASALMRVYMAQGRRQLASATFERCRAALEDLGLRASPALTELNRATSASAPQRPAVSSLGPSRVPRPSSPRVPKEERRLVSVFFAELSGPVGTSQRLDPEDLRQVVGDALAGVIAEVEGLGGTVTSVSGGGLSALFGAPEAHEDDPERAVRAGFRVLSAMRGLAGPVGSPAVRIGIETGPAVVGPLASVGRADYGAVGEVVGRAAALQSAAKAMSVLVGPSTRSATEGTFEWGPSEEVAPVPGAKPLAASYLERPKARPPGYRGRARLAGHARLVARTAELAALDEALREATSGAGSLAFVIGEPGLGKTRLVQECRKRFMAWVGAGTGRLPLWLEGRCASYASSTPYGLYQQLLSAWTGAALEEGEQVVRPALERAMRAVFGADDYQDHLALLANMMGLRAGPEGRRLAQLSPEGLQRATFASVRAVLARLAEKGPTVLALEDLHWADPTSLRLTEELAALASESPLLLLATRRPEPDPGVSGLESALEATGACLVRRLELSPLPDTAERALAMSLIGDDAASAVIETVCSGVEGNPLFLEERLSSLVETGALVRAGAGWQMSASTEEEVPEVLERLIRSRVDRLRPLPHEAIVAASVLGTEFPLSALGAVAQINGGLPAAVGELCATGLLTEVRTGPEPAYRFRHALIQEATYRGLLRAERRQLHARAAWGLEAAASERLEEVAAVLGYHYAAAGETERAVHHLEVAGDHAAAGFANEESIASYRRAIELADRDPSSMTVATAAVQLRAKMAQVLWHTGRHGEAREVLHEALRLTGPGDKSQAARLQAMLGHVETADHHYDAGLSAFDTADELLGDLPEDQDQATVDLWLEVQLDGRAMLHYWKNEPEKASTVLERARPVVESRGSGARKVAFYQNFALQLARQARYRVDNGMLKNMRAAVEVIGEGVGENEAAMAVFCLGFLLLWNGDLDEAEQHLQASMAMIDRIGDVVLRARATCYLNVTALRQHDVEGVRDRSQEALAAAEAAGYPEYVAAAKASMAWVAWKDQRFEDVIDLANEALDLWRSTVVSYSWYWLCLWPLIAVHLDAGRVTEAVEASRQLVVPPQQRLPDELESLVVSAAAAWDAGQGQLAAAHLADALELAERLRYS